MSDIKEDYSMLQDVLDMAWQQAAHGKGKERHAEGGKPFHKQDICQEARDLGLAYPVGQARKKAKEALRLTPEKAIQDLLGAINYLAATVIVVREKIETPTVLRSNRIGPEDGEILA